MSETMWSVPSIVANMLATAAVVAVCIRQYVQDRTYRRKLGHGLLRGALDDYPGVWAATGLVYEVRLALAVAQAYWGPAFGLMIFEYLLLLASSMLILWGAYNYVGVARPRWTVTVSIGLAGWLVISSMLQWIGANTAPASLLHAVASLPPWLPWIPISLATAGAYAWSGVLALKHSSSRTGRVSGWAVVALGLYRFVDLLLVSPGLFYTAPPWSETWSFTVNALFVLGLAFTVVSLARDRTLAQLVASEERFRRLVTNLPDTVFTYQLAPPSGLSYLSSAAADITGYTPQELCADPALMKRSLDAKALAALRDVVGSGAPRSAPILCRWRHKAGHNVWLEVRFVVVRGDTGAAIAVEGVARDVTAILEDQASLLRSVSLLQATMDAASDALAITDLQGRITNYNQHFAELSESTRQRLATAPELGSTDRGTPMDSTRSPGSDDGLRREGRLIDCLPAIENADVLARRERQAHNRPNLISQDLLECVDGRRLECASIPQYLGPEIVGRVWSFRDVTALTQAEGALRKAEARFQQIVEQMPFPMEVHDLDGAALLVNRAFAQLCAEAGSPGAAVGGRSLWDSVRLCGDSLQDAFRRATEGETVYLPELRVPAVPGSDNGRTRQRDLVYEVTKFPVLSQSGEIEEVVVIWRDISERLRLEERLRDSQKTETLGRLAGGVAHDFNNLLTAISGYGSMARELTELYDSEATEYLDEVLRAAQRAASLTRQLLAFSRRQVLQPQLVDLNLLIDEVSKMLGRIIGEQVELRASLAPDLGTVHVDPGQIEQVLVNLAVNARDAMPEGGTLSIETENVDLDQRFVEQHEGAQEGPFVRLTVRDTGHGFSPDAKEHMFEPFYTTKEQGTGLGLATTFGIIKQHRGNVYVSSEPGRGSVISIYLPRVAEGAEPLRFVDTPSVIPAGTESVLLVEDDPVVREIMVRSLVRLGYRVVEAPDGEEAARLAREQCHDLALLITDVVMPRVDGAALARSLVETWPDLRVLFVSGYAEHSLDLARLGDHRPGFLHKPFTGDELAIKVRHILDVH